MPAAVAQRISGGVREAGLGRDAAQRCRRP